MSLRNQVMAQHIYYSLDTTTQRFGALLAEGLLNDPEVMQYKVHPVWLKVLDNGRAIWKTNPSAAMKFGLDMWLEIGRIIGAEEGLVREQERRETRGNNLLPCAWYRCPLSATIVPYGNVMRCSGCKSVRPALDLPCRSAIIFTQVAK